MLCYLRALALSDNGSSRNVFHSRQSNALSNFLFFFGR